MKSILRNMQLQHRIEDLLKLIFRWKWLIIFTVLIFMFIASAYCVVAKEMFKSTTTILVIPQEIPDDYVKSTVTMGSEKLNTLQQEILSRTRLLNVITEFNLFPELGENKTDEDLVELMRRRIKVELLGRRRAFRIEYSDRDPQTAMNVTSRLATLFIEENIKMRQQRASGAAQFLNSHLIETKRKLDEKDKKIILFKTKYLGELPEQLNSNLSMLSRYKDEYVNNSESIRSVEDRILFMKTRISNLKAMAPQIDMSMINVNNSFSNYDANVMSLKEEIIKKKAKLSDLMQSFTVNHPEYKKTYNEYMRLQDALANLKEEIPDEKDDRLKTRKMREMAKYYYEVKKDYRKELLKVFDKTATGKLSQQDALREYKNVMTKSIEEMSNFDMKNGIESIKMKPDIIEDTMYMVKSNQNILQQIGDLVQMKKNLESELKRLKLERVDIKKNIDFYSKRLENTSRRELELKELTRDYDNLLKTYDDLLRKKTDADMSHDLEVMQKGEQFQIIDPAYLPEKPFKPRRIMILMGAFCFSIFLGIGSGSLIEIFDRSIKAPTEIKEVFDVPLLISLPEVITVQVKKKIMKKRVLIGGGILLYFMAILTFYYIYMDKIKVLISRLVIRFIL